MSGGRRYARPAYDPAVKALVQAAQDAVWTLDTIAISRGSYLDSVRRGLRDADATDSGLNGGRS